MKLRIIVPYVTGWSSRQNSNLWFSFLISDDEYITPKQEGLVLINLTKNTSRVLLDAEEKVTYVYIY